MKNIEEIKKTPGIIIKKQGQDGFGGTIFPIEYKKGKVKIHPKDDKFKIVSSKESSLETK